MKLDTRLAVFAQLGRSLKEMLARDEDNELDELIIRARNGNSWFTEDSVRTALGGVAHYLEEPELTKWAKSYGQEDAVQRTVGVVMAGNIPLVGFHDALSVLVSGHKLVAKLSSKDEVLMNFIFDFISDLEPEFKELIDREGRMNKVDAIIATGSDNTARHFKYYFGDRPHLVRGNRNGVAVLTGEETKDELQDLGKDIFTYYGLGCRNVSKLFVPDGYDFTKFYEAMEVHAEVRNHHKYANNYDYNRSVYLINSTPHLDNNYLILKEDKALTSPISVLYYEQYKGGQELQQRLEELEGQVQCVISNSDKIDAVPIGKAQQPDLYDYADGVDTMKFLNKLV